MTGPSETSNLGSVLWADAEIQSVTADYSDVHIVLRESSGRTRTVRCCGYIGYSAVGVWDEIVVERAELVETDALLEECVKGLDERYRAKLPETGSPARNMRSWKALRIYLSDGAVLKVVAAEFGSN